MTLLIKRILFRLTHPDWYRLDKRQPDYHQPCDVTEIRFGFGEYEVGSTYEFSLNPVMTYEGFISEKGLFVTEPKNTYWRPSKMIVPQRESLTVVRPKTRYFHFRFGGNNE